MYEQVTESLQMRLNSLRCNKEYQKRISCRIFMKYIIVWKYKTNRTLNVKKITVILTCSFA